jgi:hypothetical protein
MAKFSDLAKGTAQRLKGVSVPGMLGDVLAFDLRILDGSDDEAMLEAAVARTKAKGGEPKRGDPIFDFACDVELVYRAAIDSDSPEDRPERYFSKVDDVRALDRDRIAYIAARQTEFQESRSPIRHDLSPAEYTGKVLQIVAAAEGDDGPFRDFALSALRRFTRALVFASVRSAMSKSASGGSESAPSSAPTSPTKTSSPLSAGIDGEE